MLKPRMVELYRALLKKSRAGPRTVSFLRDMRELMERMGHSSTRAALIYLHATRNRVT